MLRRALAFAVVVACSLLGTVASGAARDGLLIEAQLSTGPHPPQGAPDVIVHVPAQFDAAKPLHVVVFLHGFEGCTRALVAPSPTPCRAGEPPHRAFHLAEAHARAATNTVLIVPQLAYLARDSKHHRFAEPGAFDQMVRELFKGPLAHELGGKSLADVRSVTLVAHSAGYHAAASILSDATRTTEVDNLVLLDALYASWDTFAAWALATDAHRLVSLHTQQRQTVLGNRNLASLLRARSPARRIEGSLPKTVRAHPVLIAPVATAHSEFPEKHLAELVRALCDDRATSTKTAAAR